MLDLAPIISRLKTAKIVVGQEEVAAFARVAAVSDASQALEITALPAALVLPGPDTANPADNKWSPRQIVIEYVDVLLVLRNLADARGEATVADLSVLSAAVRKTLVGYRSAGRWPLMFNSARGLGFDDQIFVWSERFETRSELIAQA